MTLETIAFGVLAIMIVGSALAVVLSKNLFHAVLWLALALTGTAGIFLMLNAEFLAAVQLLLYAGGIVTVVVFAIVVTERLVGERITQTSRRLAGGTIVSAALLALLVSWILYPQIEPLVERVFRSMALATNAFSDARMFYSYQFTNVLTLGVMLLGAGAVFWLSQRSVGAQRAVPLQRGYIPAYWLLGCWRRRCRCAGTSLSGTGRCWRASAGATWSNGSDRSGRSSMCSQAGASAS